MVRRVLVGLLVLVGCESSNDAGGGPGAPGDGAPADGGTDSPVGTRDDGGPGDPGTDGGKLPDASAEIAPPWTRQFGSSAYDELQSVTSDASGNIYVVGYTLGALSGQTSAGTLDAFVQKYDRLGTLAWTRQFGTTAGDIGDTVSVDGSGNVYVIGDTAGTLAGQTSAGDSDVFVQKYDPSGTVLWTRQFGSSLGEAAGGASVDASGNVYVAGTTSGALPGQVSAGDYDAFVSKFDGSGTLVWTRQFGSSAHEFAKAVAVDGSGNVVVAGYTGGALAGQTSAGDDDAFIRKYDAAGTLVWTRQFGSSALDAVSSLRVDANGNVYVAGYTAGALSGQTSLGDIDAFVLKYDPAGTLAWTRQFGTGAIDRAYAVGVDGSGSAYVAGHTFGALPGQTSVGGADAFVIKYDASGTSVWSRQLGTTEGDVANAVIVNGLGDVHLAGTTGGVLPSQTSAGGGDAFVMHFVP